ncbi:hypothetical protein [Burkholderia ubonensis]|uniref:hypothetical protein n=1 Tax=Burkholderia ubonensis TaxID=101571 RepID=UPI00091885A5|nr:hypothetical protein [Burkholderia ubonensis]OJA24163.1 hypothetical protein BGX87_26155 [Burkholderia ubonensis]OJA33980.1 hypothetical protein BGX87_10440 [Burkholderia ubonensis]
MQFSIQLNRIHAINGASLALRIMTNNGLPIVLPEDALEVVWEEQKEQHVTKLPCFPIWNLAKPFVKRPTVFHQCLLIITAQLAEAAEEVDHKDELAPLVLIEAGASATYTRKNVFIQPARVRRGWLTRPRPNGLDSLSLVSCG